MASFRMMHRVTGVVLSGYVVLSASQAEIDAANANLRQAGSAFRYVPNLHPLPAGPAADRAENPDEIVQPA